MRDRWRRLDPNTRYAVSLAVAFFVFRAALAGLSGFGFHQGWNEGHYALIAHGFLEHPLVPSYGSRFVYNVPPLYPYLVSASFLVFGESSWAARLPSVALGTLLVVATYWLGTETTRDRRTAFLGAALVATVPYVQLFSGRAQTDVPMVAFLTAALATIVRGYSVERGAPRWLAAGGVLFVAAVATKQPALLLAGVVLLWLVADGRFDGDTIRRTGWLVGASGLSLLPLLSWFFLNYLIAPDAFVADWAHELFGRTAAFANLPLLFAVGFGLGMTPPILLCASVGVWTDLSGTARKYAEGIRRDAGPTVLTWWLVLFGGFVLVRTPQGHQYYAVVLAPPVALQAARGLGVVARRLDGLRDHRAPAIRLALIAVVLGANVAGTAVLFELSGEFSVENGGGTRAAADAGEFLSAGVPEDATILVENGYDPPLKWYLRDDVPIDNVVPYHVKNFDEQRLQEAVNQTDGPVYLVSPCPNWGDLSSIRGQAVYRTDVYEFTVMDSLGAHVETNSKFSFYLADRRLVVYRVGPIEEDSERAGSSATSVCA